MKSKKSVTVFLKLFWGNLKDWANRERTLQSLQTIVRVLSETLQQNSIDIQNGKAAVEHLRERYKRLQSERYQSLPKKFALDIDRKYSIRATNPCSKSTHDETDSVLFLAKDMALPAALWEYRRESARLGANPAHIESIDLLIERVEEYQRTVEIKVPDTDLPCEIRRCVNGEGVNVQ